MLTRTERRVIGALLDEVLARIAGEFGLEVEKGAIWQEPEELTTLEDLGPDADSRRLFVSACLPSDEEFVMESETSQSMSSPRTSSSTNRHNLA